MRDSRRMPTQLTLGLTPRDDEPRDIDLGPGARLFRGLALGAAPELLADVAAVAARSPFRHLVTPGGKRMSVAMTNCGARGWVSDALGYRYAATDPLHGGPWPAMPKAFASLASDAAARAGFASFAPNVCLVNRYEPGARLTLHQDRDEGRFEDPIVSVSLGLPAVFLWGGEERTSPVTKLALEHGDVVVWGGASRLRYHGVLPVRPGVHSATGALRINLTFRSAAV